MVKSDLLPAPVTLTSSPLLLLSKMVEFVIVPAPTVDPEATLNRKPSSVLFVMKELVIVGVRLAPLAASTRTPFAALLETSVPPDRASVLDGELSRFRRTPLLPLNVICVLSNAPWKFDRPAALTNTPSCVLELISDRLLLIVADEPESNWISIPAPVLFDRVLPLMFEVNVLPLAASTCRPFRVEN